MWIVLVLPQVRGLKVFDRDNASFLSCLQAIIQTTEIDLVNTNLNEIVAQLGYGGYAFGIHWGAEMMPEGVAKLIGGNLVAYGKEYFENDFTSGDPVVRRLRMATQPVLWAPFIAEPRLGGADSRMDEIAACLKRHDIHAGVSIPADIGALGCRTGLSVAATTGSDAAAFDARFAENGWALRLTALAISNAIGRAAVRDVTGDLSSSERLVLMALCEGLRPRDIADRMGKSEHTIRNQIVSAQQRLGARTKEEAITKALRFGLIKV
jgi:DNA-binding CsgD family transcriptional regulator